MRRSIDVITGELIELPDDPENVVEITDEENKQTAIRLLQESDWAVISDVGNPKMSNPYLANQEEFIAYRNAIRQYVIYPVKGIIDWISVPIENWVKI